MTARGGFAAGFLEELSNKMRHIFAAVLTAFAVSPALAQDAPIAIDPNLVQSLSSAPAGLIRENPYVAHFQKGSYNLYYVSAAHENDFRGKSFRLIRRAFARFKIRRLVVEGGPYEAGPVPKERVAQIALDAKSGVFKWGEADYAIFRASLQRVRTVGGEPDAKEDLKSALKADFQPRDLLAFCFVRMIPAYRAQGRLEKEPLADLFNETMDWKRGELGLTEAFAYEDFLRWHQEKIGLAFDPAKVDDETSKPDPRGTYLQLVSEEVNNSRNRFLAEVLSQELNKYRDVLVVYGNGHHAAQRPALEAAFGKPVYEGTLSPAKP